jgi:hypothetical protein
MEGTQKSDPGAPDTERRVTAHSRQWPPAGHLHAVLGSCPHCPGCPLWDGQTPSGRHFDPHPDGWSGCRSLRIVLTRQCNPTNNSGDAGRVVRRDWGGGWCRERDSNVSSTETREALLTSRQAYSKGSMIECVVVECQWVLGAHRALTISITYLMLLSLRLGTRRDRYRFDGRGKTVREAVRGACRFINNY